MKKPSLVLLSALLAVTACSKQTEVRYYPGTQSGSSTLPVSVSSFEKDIEALRMLLNSDSPNVALGELLSKSVVREHKEEVKKLFASLSSDEAKAIIEKVQADNKSIRKNYLYHGQTFKDNKKLIEGSLLNPVLLENQTFSLESQLRKSAFAYVKSKALSEIISTYDKRAQELAKDLSNDIAIEIGEVYPDVAKEIENKVRNNKVEDAIAYIQTVKPLVTKLDQYFKNSNLSEKEQYVVTFSSIIAGAIYTQVKEKATFKRIVKECKKIAQDLNEFREKAQEFSFLVTTLESHVKATGENVEELKSGLRGVRDDLTSLKDSLETGLRNPTSNIDPKRLGDFLYRTVINGEKVDPNHLNSSILNKQTSLNKNFVRSVDAATKLTSNLDAILTTSEQMLKVFGVKNLPTPVKETMKAVKKVNQVLTVVQGAAMGYATGGPVGAVAGFASSGGLDLISGGGSGDAKLDEISRKLDMVLENQVKIMQMQVATMNMIKELAVMVDQYHQKEMAALAELKDYSLVELEMEKASLNKDIRACERIISYQLASIWKKFDYSTNSFHSLNNIEGIRERFTASITGIQDIRRIMTSLEANAYSTCQTGIAEAFGGNEASENPLLAIFTTKENENLYNFQETTYLPLVRSLEYFANTNNFDIVPLHVPTAKFDTLNLKHAYIEYARTNGNTNGNTRDNYELNHLVSVKSLERYLGNLLILNPILELDKDVWQKNYQEIISTYIENSNTENNQNSRSHFFLNNALKLVQSSIAQEALLAGEPLIVSLRDSYKDELFSMVECTDIKRADIPATEYPFFCSLRSNLLLLKNIVHYQLKSESVKENFMAQYETALQKKDVASISKLLAMNVPADRIVLSEDKENKTFVASIKIPNPNKEADGTNPHVFVKLPSVEELKAGQIMYSENMSRLIKMQSLILDAIEKVAPVKRNYEDKDLLKLILAGA